MKNTIAVVLFFLFSAMGALTQKTEHLALTPPMGWNSWNKFGCNINETVVKEMADALLKTGMNKLGYKYIVIDDCWQIARSADGTIIADSAKFPSGIKALADYIHSKGLKFGIYSCAGRLTCGQRPGSHGYEEIDAKTYAQWGVDYLKYDWCNTEGIDPVKANTKMSVALAGSGRPIVFSMCEWGLSRPWEWAKNTAHLWRTTGDIVDCWGCRTDWGGSGWTLILDQQEGLEKFAGPGHWNDPDMLEVGNGKMTYNEYVAHFSFWCLLAAPLMAGNDLRSMDDQTKAILTNTDAIRIDQDKLGMQGRKIFDEGDFEIWSKRLVDGSTAMIFFNRNEKQNVFKIDWKKIGITRNRQIFDIWKNAISGSTNSVKALTVPGHSVLFYRLK